MIETKVRLEQALSEAFAGGAVRRRELRLTDQEADWLRSRYPVLVRPIGPGGEKNWYEITFQGAEP